MNEDLIPYFIKVPDPRELYVGPDYVVLDFETDSEDKGSPLNEENDIVVACWQVVRGDKIEVKQIIGGIYDMQPLLDDIASVGFVIAMNAKFELGWLKRCGMELRDVLVYDPMLAQWVLDGNKRLPRSLRGMAKRYGTTTKLDIVGKMLDAGVPTRDINLEWLLAYCHVDVEATRQIFLAQIAELDRRDVWHLVHVRNLTCSVLADIEFEGLILDPDKVNAEYVRVAKLREEIGHKLAEKTGGINLNSPKQLAVFLYDVLGIKEPVDYKGNKITTPGGDRTANAKVLALLEPHTEEQKDFLAMYKEYNKATSLLEKNLEYFKNTCEQRGSRFYGTFKQNVVQTHRLASSGIPVLFTGKKKPMSVQLQNIPREYKEMFCSGDADWVVAEFDSAQLEFRVAVDLGKDKVGLHEIETGVDVHSFTAKVMTENGEPTTRQEAKAKTFRPLFGGGSGSDALQAYCEYFKDKYADLSQTQRNWALTVADRGEFTTPYGMTFYFPGTKIQRSGYITNSTNIYNYPIQGFATGEIIPIALIYFWHKTRNLPVRIFSTIHDSIACKILKGYEEQVTEVAKQALTTDVYEFLRVVYKYNFRVPLGLGAKVGTFWGKGHEKKWDIYRDGTEIDRT